MKTLSCNGMVPLFESSWISEQIFIDHFERRLDFLDFGDIAVVVNQTMFIQCVNSTNNSN